MPIRVIFGKGRHRPTIICDACDQPITASGNVLWDPDEPDRVY